VTETDQPEPANGLAEEKCTADELRKAHQAGLWGELVTERFGQGQRRDAWCPGLCQSSHIKLKP